jgi:hypothetical protein
MDKLREELKITCEYIVEQFGAMNILLDYTPESVKYLDLLFEDEYKNGELRNPTGSFAKREGAILTGISSYLTEIFLQNSNDTKVEIDSRDENWYVNYRVVGSKVWTVMPGQRVIKRKLEGSESDFYGYVTTMLDYFNDKNSNIESTTKKPWWKF